MNINWERFGDLYVNILKEGLTDIVEGAEDDITDFVQKIVLDAEAALMLPLERREVVLEELVMQLSMIGEVNRIRAVNEGWEMAGKVVRTSLRTILALSTIAA